MTSAIRIHYAAPRVDISLLVMIKGGEMESGVYLQLSKKEAKALYLLLLDSPAERERESMLQDIFESLDDSLDHVPV